MLEFLGGKHGVWGAAAAGVVAPTLSTYPIVQDLWQQKAVSLGVVMSVVVSTRLLNIQSVLFFLPFLGWQLTLISIGVGIALTIVFVSITKIIG